MGDPGRGAFGELDPQKVGFGRSQHTGDAHAVECSPLLRPIDGPHEPLLAERDGLPPRTDRERGATEASDLEVALVQVQVVGAEIAQRGGLFAPQANILELDVDPCVVVQRGGYVRSDTHRCVVVPDAHLRWVTELEAGPDLSTEVEITAVGAPSGRGDECSDQYTLKQIPHPDLPFIRGVESIVMQEGTACGAASYTISPLSGVFLGFT